MSPPRARVAWSWRLVLLANEESGAATCEHGPYKFAVSNAMRFALAHALLACAAGFPAGCGQSSAEPSAAEQLYRLGELHVYVISPPDLEERLPPLDLA